jgi:hypothetical protein
MTKDNGQNCVSHRYKTIDGMNLLGTKQKRNLDPVRCGQIFGFEYEIKDGRILLVQITPGGTAATCKMSQSGRSSFTVD